MAWTAKSFREHVRPFSAWHEEGGPGSHLLTTGDVHPNPGPILDSSTLLDVSGRFSLAVLLAALWRDL